MSTAAPSFLARRSNSTASLAQFYHDAGAGSGSGAGASGAGSELDFCNAFWGRGDAGYEVLMARVRASGKTVDELKAFWKERWARGLVGMHAGGVPNLTRRRGDGAQGKHRGGLCETVDQARKGSTRKGRGWVSIYAPVVLWRGVAGRGQQEEPEAKRARLAAAANFGHASMASAPRRTSRLARGCSSRSRYGAMSRWVGETTIRADEENLTRTPTQSPMVEFAGRMSNLKKTVRAPRPGRSDHAG